MGGGRGRRKLEETEAKSRIIAMRADADLYDKLERIAAVWRCDLSVALRLIVSEHLDEYLVRIRGLDPAVTPDAAVALLEEASAALRKAKGADAAALAARIDAAIAGDG